MDGAKERDDDGAVAELEWLHQVKKVVSGVMVDVEVVEEGIAGGQLLCEIP